MKEWSHLHAGFGDDVSVTIAWHQHHRQVLELPHDLLAVGVVHSHHCLHSQWSEDVIVIINSDSPVTRVGTACSTWCTDYQCSSPAAPPSHCPSSARPGQPGPGCWCWCRWWRSERWWRWWSGKPPGYPPESCFLLHSGCFCLTLDSWSFSCWSWSQYQN